MSTSVIRAENPVHVVFVDQTGTRTWLRSTDRQQNLNTGQWTTTPLRHADPRESRPMRYDFAQVAVERWRREFPRLSCHIALEPFGEFVDDEPVAVTDPNERSDYFIPTDVSGRPVENAASPWGYHVRAVLTPNGPKYCLRFPSSSETGKLEILENQAVFADEPERCVEIAFEKGYTKIVPPSPNPHRERFQQQATQATQATQAAQQTAPQFRHRRPGDFTR